MITIGQLIEWIEKNRHGKVFDTNKDVILSEIYLGLSHGVFVYHEENGEIQGVACGEVDQTRHVVWIHDVLTTKPSIIRKFMERFLLVFPGYVIEGQRHTRLRRFKNPNKVLERLSYGQNHN